jgi:hypothetical protein
MSGLQAYLRDGWAAPSPKITLRTMICAAEWREPSATPGAIRTLKPPKHLGKAVNSCPKWRKVKTTTLPGSGTSFPNGPEALWFKESTGFSSVKSSVFSDLVLYSLPLWACCRDTVEAVLATPAHGPDSLDRTTPRCNGNGYSCLGRAATCRWMIEHELSHLSHTRVCVSYSYSRVESD